MKYALEEIERGVGNAFEWRGAPQAADIMRQSGTQCAEELLDVNSAVFPYFSDAARDLIAKLGAEKAVCAALARLSGFTETPRTRSLLASEDGMVTLQFRCGKEILGPGYVFGEEYCTYIYAI